MGGGEPRARAREKKKKKMNKEEKKKKKKKKASPYLIIQKKAKCSWEEADMNPEHQRTETPSLS